MNRTQQKGLSLVELIVAFGLASFIIAGIIQVVLSNQKAFNLTESMVRVQESGRFALNFIADDIRQSGGYGCTPTFDAVSQNIQSFAANMTDINAIQTQASGAFGNSLDGAAGGTGAFDAPDQLAVLRLNNQNGASITGGVVAPTTLSMATGGTFAVGDYVLVSNCEVADLIQLAAGTNNLQIVSGSNQLRFSFYTRQDKRSTINEIENRTFTVDIAADVLVLNINGGPDLALLGGIENIQYRYGVDLDGDLVPDYFDDITAVPAGRMDDIIAVHVSLLTVSGSLLDGAGVGTGDVASVTSSPQTISFNGKTLTMPDNRLRKVFETTVILRNRMN
ncbi:PilW family protein [Reinekea sp.]|jgi:type IV pilus assembly protein PilW|uniref:PilW family protein n=1 Tax=Reinekea sp. TaxID=1970455 RepID=UPI002A834119|nr:PilW family protein [Reinekea sp.]